MVMEAWTTSRSWSWRSRAAGGPASCTSGRDRQGEGMMAKLTLQFEGRVLKEYVVGKSLTIGRLPDNTIVIENPAVSAHHARVFRDGDHVVVEDLKSTNGTFVNEQHVDRHVLRSGDAL